MDRKAKYLSVFLLFVGLFIGTVAVPVNCGKISQSALKVEKGNDLYSKAEELVKKAERTLDKKDVAEAKKAIKKVKGKDTKSLSKRLDNVSYDIKARELVEKLESIVNNAKNKSDINYARYYNEQNKISDKVKGVHNHKLKNELEKKLSGLLVILNDKKDPKVSIKDGTITNKDVRVVVNDDNKVSIVLNGNEIKNNSEVKKEGKYILVVTDKAFNVTVVNFTIDKTAPKVNIKDGTVTNKDVKVEVKDETKVKTYLNHRPFDIKDEISKEGKYELVCEDEAGNKTVVRFTIDKTAPKVNIKDGTVTNKDLRIIVDDKDASIKLNGRNVRNYSEVTKEGKYVLVCEDKAGNKTVVKFTIDKTAPKVNVKDNTLTNENVFIKACDESKITLFLNKKEIHNHYLVSEDGDYFLLVKDEAGNKTIVRFTIDKTGPVVNVKDGTITNKDVKIIVKDKHEFTLKLNGKKIRNYTTVKDEGEYVLVAKDKLGNKTIVKFRIDKTVPVITLKDESVGSNGVYSKPSFKLYDNVGIDKVVVNDTQEFKMSVNQWGDFNYGDYINYVEGENKVTLYDVAGNSASYVVKVDKTAPVITLKDSSVGSHGYYSKPSFKLYDNVGIAKVVVNDTQEFKMSVNQWGDFNYGDYINYVEGENKVTLYDVAGNSTSYVVKVDKTAPVITLKEGSTNARPNFKLYDNVGIAKVVVNGKEFNQSFSKWGDLNYGEWLGYKAGLNTIVLYDAAGNSVTYEHTIVVD